MPKPECAGRCVSHRALEQRRHQCIGLDAINGLPDRRAAGDAGFTLIELAVVVAIIAIGAGVACETLAQRPAQARTSALAFAGLVSEARTLAAISGDGTVADGSGASIGVTHEGADYVATLYAYRPIRGAAHSPIVAPNRPPLRMPTAVALLQGASLLAPPFALFFSASGHVSALAGFRLDRDAAPAGEPDCPLATGIRIAFADGVHEAAYPLSCMTATLDLDTTYPLGAP